jgi:hypothetical protein
VAKSTPADPGGVCAAVTRNGQGCRNPAMPGQPLCRIHAGDRSQVAEGANSLYEEGIGEDERRLWDRISVTDLDAEIRIAKLQLKRLLAAQKRAELAAREEPSEPTPTRKTVRRMTAKARAIDYDDRVNRLLGRISDLVVTRAKLQRDADAKQKERDEPADDPVERLARRIDRVAARIGAKPDSGEPDAGGG